MPRYFFHAKDGTLLCDEAGTLLDDLEAAKAHAAQYLSESLNHNSDRIWETGHFTVTATDHRGLTLFTLDLAAIIAPAAVISPVVWAPSLRP